MSCGVSKRAIWAMLTVAMLPACATAPRVLVLRNYERVVPPGAVRGLAGVRVFVAPVSDARSFGETWSDMRGEDDPPDYESADPSADAERHWNADVQQGTQAASGPRHLLANDQVRLCTVSSLNPPVEWLEEALRIDLAGQGAELVDSADSADLILELALRHLSADLNLSTRSTVVAEVAVTRDGATHRRTICTRGSVVAWTGSAWEYYLAIRYAGQRLVWHTMRWAAGIEQDSAAP